MCVVARCKQRNEVVHFLCAVMYIRVLLRFTNTSKKEVVTNLKQTIKSVVRGTAGVPATELGYFGRNLK